MQIKAWQCDICGEEESRTKDWSVVTVVRGEEQPRTVDLCPQCSNLAKKVLCALGIKWREGATKTGGQWLVMRAEE